MTLKKIPAEFSTIIATILLVLAACGCRGQEFKASIEAYHDDIKDGMYDKAAMLVDDAERTRFLMTAKTWGSGRHVTEYYIRQAVINESKTQATVNIVRKYYTDLEMDEQEQPLVQTWEKKGKNWFLVRGDF